MHRTYYVYTIYTNKSTNFRRLTHTFISTLIFVISSILSRWPIYAAQYYHLLHTKNAFTPSLLRFTGRYIKPHSLETVMVSNSKYIIFIINVSRQIRIVTLYHYWPRWKSYPTTHIPLGIAHSESIIHFTIFSNLFANVNNSDIQY